MYVYIDYCNLPTENDGQVLVLDERENRSVHVIRHDVYYLVLELDKSPPALTTWSEVHLVCDTTFT